jgi:hypothetical protein
MNLSTLFTEWLAMQANNQKYCLSCCTHLAGSLLSAVLKDKDVM